MLYPLSYGGGTSADTSAGKIAPVRLLQARWNPDTWRIKALCTKSVHRQSERFHTSYGDAWVALGRILLDTPWLSHCGPGLGTA